MNEWGGWLDEAPFSQRVSGIAVPCPVLGLESSLLRLSHSGAKARVVCGSDGTAKAVPFHDPRVRAVTSL